MFTNPVSDKGLEYKKDTYNSTTDSRTTQFTNGQRVCIDHSLKKCGEVAALTPCWWERKRMQPLCRTDWNFLRRLDIELPFDPGVCREK